MKYLLYFTLFVTVSFSAIAQKTLTPIDASSTVGFTIKNFGIAVDGKLSGLKGSIIINEKDPTKSTIDVTVDVATINTKNDKRDKHLRNKDYFEAEKYTIIRIKSNAITVTKTSGVYLLKANLTIKNIVKEISFQMSVLPTGKAYLFVGSFDIDRTDYNVGKSSMALADVVKVNLKVLAE